MRVSSRRGALAAVARLLVIAAGLLVPVTASAIDWSTRVPAEYRAWTVKTKDGQETKVVQIYLPVVGTISLHPSTRLVVSGAAGRSSFDRPQTSIEGEAGPSQTDALAAATDVKLQVFHKTMGDHLLLLGGVNVPTGKRELSRTDLEIMQAAVHPLLGMRLKQYGGGLDLNAGAALSLPLASGLEFGLGVGYRLAGSYTLIEGGEDYQPTSEASGSLALEVASAERDRTLQVRVTGRFYGEDRLAGQRIFEEGDQLDAAIQVGARRGGLRAVLSTQAIFKKDDRVYQPPRDAASRVTETSPGTGAVTHANVSHQVGGRLEIGLAADWKRFQVSNVDAYNGNAYGIGPAFGVRVGGAGWVRCEAMVLSGSSGQGIDSLDLSGLAIAASLRWGS